MPTYTAKQIWDNSKNNPIELLQNILDSGAGGKPEAARAAITLRAAFYSRRQARWTFGAAIFAAVSAAISAGTLVWQILH